MIEVKTYMIIMIVLIVIATPILAFLIYLEIDKNRSERKKMEERFRRSEEENKRLDAQMKEYEKEIEEKYK